MRIYCLPVPADLLLLMSLPKLASSFKRDRKTYRCSYKRKEDKKTGVWFSRHLVEILGLWYRPAVQLTFKSQLVHFSYVWVLGWCFCTKFHQSGVYSDYICQSTHECHDDTHVKHPVVRNCKYFFNKPEVPHLIYTDCEHRGQVAKDGHLQTGVHGVAWTS